MCHVPVDCLAGTPVREPCSDRMNPAPIIVEQPFAEPEDVAMRFAGRRRLAFLHSAMPHETLGRWSYVAADPFGVFSVRDGVAFWNDEALDLPPMEALRACLARHATPRVAGGPPFQGGAIGHLAYEAGHLFEKLPFPDSEGGPLRQVELAFYDRLVAIDSLDRRLFVIAPPGASGSRHQRRVTGSAAIRSASRPSQP